MILAIGTSCLNAVIIRTVHGRMIMKGCVQLNSVYERLCATEPRVRSERIQPLPGLAPGTAR